MISRTIATKITIRLMTIPATAAPVRRRLAAITLSIIATRAAGSVVNTLTQPQKGRNPIIRNKNEIRLKMRPVMPNGISLSVMVT